MISPLRLFVLVVPLVVFAGCSTTQPTPARTAPLEVVHSDDLIEYLGRRGVLLRPAGLTGPSVLDAIGQQFRIRGDGALQVFEFEEAETARDNVETYIIAARGGGSVALFQRGVLMVAYYGPSPSIVAVLTEVLGPPTY